MYVVMHCTYGDPDKAVGFISEEETLEYVKPYLKQWDTYNLDYQCSVNALSTVEEAQELIEQEAIYTLQIWKVDMHEGNKLK